MFDELYSSGLSSEGSLLFPDSNFLPLTQMILRFLVPRAPLVGTREFFPAYKRRLFRTECHKILTLNSPVSSSDSLVTPPAAVSQGPQEAHSRKS